MLAQRRVLSASLLVSATVALFACKSATQPPPGASGAEIFALQLCANCHGDGGEGRWLGPPLRELVLHWDADRLAEFFADPERFSAEGRLAELAERYPKRMEPYANLSREERLRLADWVLGL